MTTAIGELDRVLGGGLVAGSVTLLGGEPGIGKSTLLLQLLAGWSGPTLYVTAEESAQQVKRRAERLGATRDDLWLHAETSLPHILDTIERIRPELVVIDSIQTVSDPGLGSLPGSVGQVRGSRNASSTKPRNAMCRSCSSATSPRTAASPDHECSSTSSTPCCSSRAIATTRCACCEHRNTASGPTNELGLFEMAGAGLIAVPDASSLFLADRRTGVPGSAVVPTMEGQRPIVVEVQALANAGVAGVPPRRSALGLDGARLSMLMAVLGRRSRVAVADQDVYASTAGGVKLSEPGLDLGVCLAVVSTIPRSAAPRRPRRVRRGRPGRRTPPGRPGTAAIHRGGPARTPPRRRAVELARLRRRHRGDPSRNALRSDRRCRARRAQRTERTATGGVSRGSLGMDPALLI